MDTLLLGDGGLLQETTAATLAGEGTVESLVDPGDDEVSVGTGCLFAYDDQISVRDGVLNH